MNKMNQVLTIIILATLASCAAVPYKPYAREAKKKPGVEGVIALHMDYLPEDRTLADTLMAKNCGASSVNVLEEGEVVTGTKTTSKSQTQDNNYRSGLNFGGIQFGSTKDSTAQTDSTTTTQKEWQISYNCKTQVAEVPVKEEPKKSKKVEVAKNKIEKKEEAKVEKK